MAFGLSQDKKYLLKVEHYRNLRIKTRYRCFNDMEELKKIGSTWYDSGLQSSEYKIWVSRLQDRSGKTLYYKVESWGWGQYYKLIG